MVVKKPGGTLVETYLLEAISPEVVCDKFYSVLHWTDDPDDVGEATHPGITFWRPLTHPGPKTEQYPHGKIAPEMEQKLWDIAQEFTGKSYERNPLEMVYAGAAMDTAFWGETCCACCIGKKGEDDDDADLESVFCSELCAHAYIETGVIKGDEKAYMYLPKDFSSDPHNKLQDVMTEEHQLLNEVMCIRNLSKYYKYDPDGTYESEDKAALQREDRANKEEQFVRTPSQQVTVRSTYPPLS